ncbi:hypothetical protein AA14337_3013 [Acetobacter malorum DSM 14337]|uniref:Uncharacterized protein n=1 Tax=Acetobacter malorum DSM 14337 TaxID=1307910 RepID=A0ABQ0PZ53_9PROT|nr:hypothetical protein AD930_10720 [Acetobacter malorum]GBQ85214.1 hypothetical protein AA14337_3013 [Acetobacter malorum DSM 14337]
MFQDIMGGGSDRPAQKKRDFSRKRYDAKPRADSSDVHGAQMHGVVEGGKLFGNEAKSASDRDRSFRKKKSYSGERSSGPSFDRSSPVLTPKPRMADPVVLVGGSRPEAIQSLMSKLFSLGFPTCGSASDFLSSGFIRAVEKGNAACLGGCAVAVPSDYCFDQDFPYDSGRCIALWIDTPASRDAKISPARTSGSSGRCFEWLRKASQGRVMRIPSTSVEGWKTQIKELSRFLNYELPEC